jgi:dTDP-glucose 4,6-dehydratase
MNTSTFQNVLPHKPTKLLVTGGAGFIGSNFVRYWLKRYPDDTLIVVDALTYAGNRASLSECESLPNYHFVHADITDAPKMQEVMKDVSLVVHFAAESHVDRSILDPSIFVKTNVLGTQVLLDAALRAGVKRFHHISTDEVFGTLPLDSQAQFSELTPYDPRSPYSASKAGSDFLVRAYGETYDLEYTITNCSNNYGPFHFPEKLIPLAITNILEGKKVPVYGDGLQVRDWLFVRDHCRAIELVLLSGASHSTFLVGGLTEDISNLAVVKEILSLMNASEDSIEFVTDRPGHDRRYSVDWSKIKRDLGWEPSVSFSEGLHETISWYQENRAWWEPLKSRNKEYFDKQYAHQAHA